MSFIFRSVKLPGEVTSLIDLRGFPVRGRSLKDFWPQISSNGDIFPQKISFGNRASIADLDLEFPDTVHFSINSGPNSHKSRVFMSGFPSGVQN